MIEQATELQLQWSGFALALKKKKNLSIEDLKDGWMRVVSHPKSEQHESVRGARGSRDTQLNPKPPEGRQSVEPQQRVCVSGAKTSAVSWEKKTEGGYHGVRKCL